MAQVDNIVVSSQHQLEEAFDIVYEPGQFPYKFDMNFQFRNRKHNTLADVRRWFRYLNIHEIEKYTQGWGNEILKAHHADYVAVYDLRSDNAEQNYIARMAVDAKRKFDIPHLPELVDLIEDISDFWFVEGDIFRRTYTIGTANDALFHYDDTIEGFDKRVFDNNVEKVAAHSGLLTPCATIAGKWSRQVKSSERVGVISLEQQNQAEPGKIVVTAIPAGSWVIIGVDGEPYSNTNEVFQSIYEDQPNNNSAYY